MLDAYTVKAMLYCAPVNSSSSFIPATRALAMLLPSCPLARVQAKGFVSLHQTLTIQEAEQVQYCEQRYQSEVDLSKDTLRFFGIEDDVFLLRSVSARSESPDVSSPTHAVSCGMHMILFQVLDVVYVVRRFIELLI